MFVLPVDTLLVSRAPHQFRGCHCSGSQHVSIPFRLKSTLSIRTWKYICSTSIRKSLNLKQLADKCSRKLVKQIHIIKRSPVYCRIAEVSLQTRKFLSSHGKQNIIWADAKSTDWACFRCSFWFSYLYRIIYIRRQRSISACRSSLIRKLHLAVSRTDKSEKDTVVPLRAKLQVLRYQEI